MKPKLNIVIDPFAVGVSNLGIVKNCGRRIILELHVAENSEFGVGVVDICSYGGA